MNLNLIISVETSHEPFTFYRFLFTYIHQKKKKKNIVDNVA